MKKQLFLDYVFRAFAMLLLFGLTLLAYRCDAQVNQYAKGLYSYNVTDTAALQTQRALTQTNYGNVGLLYFDKTRNKWRVWNGTIYVDLVVSTAPVITASNGLTKVGNDIRLGGTMSSNTSINGNSSNLTLGISSSGQRLFNFTVNADNVVNINSVSGAISLLSSAGSININAPHAAGTININTGTDGFAIDEALNTLAMNDGTKLVGNPNATRSGINTGTHTALPSSPELGDIVTVDAADDVIYGYANSSWIPISTLKYSAAVGGVDFPNTAAHTQSTLAVGIGSSNVAVGDPVNIAFVTIPPPDGIIYAYVSAANTVTFVYTNTSTAAIDPAGINFNLIVFRR